ncbi:MAG: hypothetical protein AAFN93_11485 [Bacteroidota bacterium]
MAIHPLKLLIVCLLSIVWILYFIGFNTSLNVKFDLHTDRVTFYKDTDFSLTVGSHNKRLILKGFDSLSFRPSHLEMFCSDWIQDQHGKDSAIFQEVLDTTFTQHELINMSFDSEGSQLVWFNSSLELIRIPGQVETAIEHKSNDAKIKVSSRAPVVVIHSHRDSGMLEFDSQQLLYASVTLPHLCDLSAFQMEADEKDPFQTVRRRSTRGISSIRIDGVEQAQSIIRDPIVVRHLSFFAEKKLKLGAARSGILKGDLRVNGEDYTLAKGDYLFWGEDNELEIDEIYFLPEGIRVVGKANNVTKIYKGMTEKHAAKNPIIIRRFFAAAFFPYALASCIVIVSIILLNFFAYQNFQK